MEGRSRVSGPCPAGLISCAPGIDSGRNNFGLVLRAIVPAVAVMQATIDPDKPLNLFNLIAHT